MSLGHRFQSRVLVWCAGQILLQARLTTPFVRDDKAFPTEVWTETNDHVDDVRLAWNNGIRLYAQCKTTLNISLSASNEWSKAWNQLAREFAKLESQKSDVDLFRLALLYENHNGNLQKLKGLLNRFRDDGHARNLTDVANSTEERDVATKLNATLDAIETANPALSPLLTQQRHKFLRVVYIHQLQLGEGEADAIPVVTLLQHQLLHDSNQLGSAINALKTWADTAMAERRTRDREGLRLLLRDASISLQNSCDLRGDLQRLEKITEGTLENFKDRGSLLISGTRLSIQRDVLTDLEKDLAQQTAIPSLLLTGESGIGKTGVLIGVVRYLRDAGSRVWFWGAEDHPRDSLASIKLELGLENSWEEIFADVAASGNATLVIDGLDALRSAAPLQAYETLLRTAREYQITVIASIREFDLQRQSGLQKLFPQPTIIKDLTEAELGQVEARIPALSTLIPTGSDLRQVVRIPFNLDLLCQLIGDQATQLSQISTQDELFNRFWETRIRNTHLDTRFHHREEILKQLVQSMVRERRLQIDISDLNPDQKSDVDALKSLNVLRDVQKSGLDRLSAKQFIEFRHNLLFDYAAKRLFVAPNAPFYPTKARELEAWGTFLLPSLRLFYADKWQNPNTRDGLWEQLATLEESSKESRKLSPLFKLPGYLTVAELAKSPQNLQSLLDGCRQPSPQNERWLHLLYGILAAIDYTSNPGAPSQGSSNGDLPRVYASHWLEVALELVVMPNEACAQAGRRLLPAPGHLDLLPTETQRQINRAETALIESLLDNQIPTYFRHRDDVTALIETKNAALESTKVTLRRLMQTSALASMGAEIAGSIAQNVTQIWADDPAFIVEIYERLFGFCEEDNSCISVPNSIFGFQISRRDSYNSALHQLKEEVSRFLNEHPRHAVKAFLAALGHLHPQKQQGNQEQSDWLEFSLKDGSIGRTRHGDWLGGAFANSIRDDRDLLRHWQDFLTRLPAQSNADEIWRSIASLVLEETALRWLKHTLLQAAATAPNFYLPKIWQLLLEPALLMGQSTEALAVECLKNGAHLLSQDQLGAIQKVILEAPLTALTETKETRYLCDETDKALLLSSIPFERQTSSTREFLKKNPPPKRNAAPSGQPRPHPLYGEAGPNIHGIRNPEWLQAVHEVERLAATPSAESLPLFLEAVEKVEVFSSSTEGEPGTLRMVNTSIIRCCADVAGWTEAQSQPFRNVLMKRFQTLLAPIEQLIESVIQGSSVDFEQRKYAARGFLLLIRLESLSDEEETTFSIISEDPMTRAELASAVWRFWNSNSERVWSWLETWVDQIDSKNSDNQEQLHAVFSKCGRFIALQNSSPERAQTLITKLLSKSIEAGDSLTLDFWGECLSFLAWKQEVPWAQEFLTEALNDIPRHATLLKGACYRSITWILGERQPTNRLAHLGIKEQPVAQAEQLSENMSEAATIWTVSLIDAINQSVRQHVESLQDASTTDKESEPPQWAQLAKWQIEYLAQKVSDLCKVSAEDWKVDPNLQQKGMAQLWAKIDRLFFQLTSPDSLPLIPNVSLLIEGMAALAPYEPKHALAALARISEFARPYGSQSSAIEPTILILQISLDNLKLALIDSPEQEVQFIQPLNALLELGEPKAYRLAFDYQTMLR